MLEKKFKIETLEETCATIKDIKLIAYRKYDRSVTTEKFPYLGMILGFHKNELKNFNM